MGKARTKGVGPMRKHLIAATLAVALAACNADTSSDPPTTSSDPPTEQSADASGPLRAPPPVEEELIITVSSSVDAVEDIGDPAEAAAAVGPLAVDSSALPPDLVTALRDGGGELATSADWSQRFEVDGFPFLDGNGVHLVEATLQVTPKAAGWQRLDEMQWLFVASTSRDDLLDLLAQRTGVTDWNRAETTSVVDSADCVIREYTSPQSSNWWTLQGCEFSKFDNMVSIGVSRNTVTSTPGSVPFLDPSVPDVVDDVEGEIVEMLVTFGPPAPGSTSTLTMSLGVASGVDNPAVVLNGGALGSWSRENGEAGTAIFAGAPGSYWTVISNDIRFTNEGRLAP